MNFRFLTTGHLPARMNMAIDEAVLDAVATKTSAPTLRLYGWKPAAISIGYFQSLEEEIDLAACAKSDTEFVRRVTGGGAVLHEHELTYSIHIPESAALVPNGILESYRAISEGVIKGLAVLGVTAKFVPLNDLIVMNGEMPQKISGNAQTRKQGVILQHGTILLRVDVEKMFSLLKVPDEKLKGKMIATIKERVTSISHFLGREVGFEEALDAVRTGFAQAFPQCTFEAAEISSEEMRHAEQLAKEKYGNDSWNKQR
ncbi:lipoate--protein ligase [Candidatus Peregrinibacteria bacterium CG11_big_fil_rev_8_21_14_0_20_46_8]|nr:MAG: lipoate--protein ligase [Candidatus Peregrinibacteria bacterium CG11_big_fil_rev_8_21_14_0_20_46_8]